MSPANGFSPESPALQSKLLFMTSGSSRQGIYPEQVRTLALPRDTSYLTQRYSVIGPKVLHGPDARPNGSEITIRDVVDPSFSVEAVSRFERPKGIFSAKRYDEKLIASSSYDALVLAAYADVLRERKRAAQFQLKLELLLPKELLSKPSFAETLEAATHSKAAREAGVRALAAFERPTTVIMTSSSVTHAIGEQRRFLQQVFTEESVYASMTKLYGVNPDEADELYMDAFAGNSDAYNAAFAVKLSLPSASSSSNPQA